MFNPYGYIRLNRASSWRTNGSKLDGPHVTFRGCIVSRAAAAA